jgi:hypothetical protein
MRALRAVLLVILAPLAMTACFGRHCVEVANGRTFPILRQTARRTWFATERPRLRSVALSSGGDE